MSFSFERTAASQPSQPHAEGPSLLSVASEGSSTQPSWTYLVNLTATMIPENGAGSGYKYNQLKNLQDLTRNSNSEVIVQEYDNATGLLRRYEIDHGKIAEAQPVKSAGTAQDLENLVAMAPKQGHLALINEAHGNGDIGFMGDAGNLSVSQFESAVRSGLTAGGRSRLDLLSMDSCLMGNVQVLKTVAPLAKTVVASELEEFSSIELGATPPKTDYDMQPLDSYLAALLKSPPASGKDAAHKIFEVSSKLCDAEAPTENGCGTPTMAIYDTQAAASAEHALDTFGGDLQIAIKDPAVKKSVDNLVGQYHDVSQVDDHLRDVASFAQGIIDLVDRGTIADRTGRLKSDAQAVLKADSGVVQQFYINPDAPISKYVGPTTLHGLNAFIPSSDFDIRGHAEDIVGSKDAQTLPLSQLLNIEIQTSLPDDDNAGWSKFVRALRSP